MSAFLALLRNELLLLLRQNVLGVAVATVVVYSGGIYLLPPEQHHAWVPAILMSEIATMGVLFIGAVLFIEVRQQTALAFAVTPASTVTWISAKLATFTALSTIAAALVLVLTKSYPVSVLVGVAVVLSALLYNQVGFILSLWTENVRDFFLPLSVVMGLLGLSIYWHLGVADDSVLFWLLPSYPAMLLLGSGATGMPALSATVAVVCLLAWNLAAFWLCRHFFHRRVSARLGG